MKNLFFILFGLSFLLTQCRSKQPDLVEVARDITITRANAFSELFLDSLQVENLIAAQQQTDTAQAVSEIFTTAVTTSLPGLQTVD